MWSLAIEEQFYFLWPLVIFLLPERYLSAVCIVFAATALGLRVLPSMQAIQATHHEFLYRLTPFRIEPLCYGALIAAVSRMKHMTRIRGWSGPICLVLGVALLGLLWVHGHSFAYYSLSMATFGYTAAGLCSSGVILLALRYQGTATGYAWLLRSSFLRTFGKYSYALYIFHSPIAQYSFKAVHHFIHNLLISSGVAFILGGGLSLLLAKLSWMYFEAPILSLKDRFAHYRREVQFPAAAEESLASSGVAAEG
jgi:peptidoglycan/LPS O-acetylase OafA/YrhL